MNRKLLGIILLILIIITGYLVFDMTKDEVHLEVHGEQINNSSEIFVVTTILDSNGNIVDTNYGKLTVELLENNGCCGEIIEECPVYHGQSIFVHSYDDYRYTVHYDGGYFYKPADASGDFVVKNQTNLTFDNITRGF